MTRAPAQAPGPRVYELDTICRQARRIVLSAPAAVRGIGCEDRISVTEDHLSFDGNCGDRRSGRSNGVQPSLSSVLALTAVVLAVGAEAPRNFMASTRATGTAVRAERAHHMVSGPCFMLDHVVGVFPILVVQREKR
jgi:hypothetical protein